MIHRHRESGKKWLNWFARISSEARVASSEVDLLAKSNWAQWRIVRNGKHLHVPGVERVDGRMVRVKLELRKGTIYVDAPWEVVVA